MGITIHEFKTAMETLNATRLSDQKGSRYDVYVPCFRVMGVQFLHSGSYYVVHKGEYIPAKILNKAMAEFGEKRPGGDNFWWGEIHSVKGILTLALMLEKRYSKELLDKLTNETYKKLFSDSTLIQSNIEIPFNKLHSQKMKQLFDLVNQYDSIINPLGNRDLCLGEPIHYLDKIKIQVDFDKTNHYASLHLEKNNVGLRTIISSNESSYRFFSKNEVEKGEHEGYTCMLHYYDKLGDEFIYLNYKVNDDYDEGLEDIDLRISMKTGLAWKTYHEKEATPATDEQIEMMITYLKNIINKINNEFISNMLLKKV